MLKTYLQALISALLAKVVLPYKDGDVIVQDPDFVVSGRLTDGGKGVMFLLPLNQPIIAKLAIVTRLKLTIRGVDGVYAIDSEDVLSYVDSVTITPFGLSIRLQFPEPLNTKNNTPIAVQINELSLSFASDSIYGGGDKSSLVSIARGCLLCLRNTYKHFLKGSLRARERGLVSNHSPQAIILVKQLSPMVIGTILRPPFQVTFVLRQSAQISFFQTVNYGKALLLLELATKAFISRFLRENRLDIFYLPMLKGYMHTLLKVSEIRLSLVGGICHA